MNTALPNARRLGLAIVAFALHAGVGCWAAPPTQPGTPSARPLAPAATKPVLPVAVKSLVGKDGAGRLVRRVIVVQPKTIQPKQILGHPVGAPSPAAEKAAAKAPVAPEHIRKLVHKAAGEYQVDPLLVEAVISVESNYNPHAISPKGARGLMQLMPGTAAQLGVRNAFDMEENIRGGVKFLKQLQETYKDERLVLAAYNAGPGAVNRYQWIPPYRETQEYVWKVGSRYGAARRAAANSPAPRKNATENAEAKSAPAEPQYRRLVSYTDAQGRLYLSTQ